MGQKVRPTGFRVGVMETWRSRWYASKREFGDLLLEDQKIRKFVATKYEFAEIARVEIERTRDQVVVHMHTARPGVIIGRKGQEVDKLKAELEDLTGRRMDVKIVEITNPNRNAKLVAMKIAQQLQKRGSFRRAIKKTLDEVMSSGVVWCENSDVGTFGRCRNVATGEGESRIDSLIDSSASYRLRLGRIGRRRWGLLV